MHREIGRVYHLTEPSKISGFKEALIAVERLQELKLGICEKREDWDPFTSDTTHTPTQTLFEKLEPLLRARMTQRRGTSKYHLGTFVKAQREAHLDIHGEGRLGEDKRPGIVASRTRQQLRNLASIGEDGTVPKRIISKYDSNGEIAWHVAEILDARKSSPDGVEFQVKCASLTGIHAFEQSGDPLEKSWESTSALNNRRWLIVQFYRKHPKAYGKQEVADAWKLCDRDGGEEAMVGRLFTKDLTSIINREALIEQREAEMAARKRIRVAKGKKAKKLKSVNH